MVIFDLSVRSYPNSLGLKQLLVQVVLLMHKIIRIIKDIELVYYSSSVIATIFCPFESIKGCVSLRWGICERQGGKCGGWGNQEEGRCGGNKLHGLARMKTPGEVVVIVGGRFAITNLVMVLTSAAKVFTVNESLFYPSSKSSRFRSPWI